MDTQTLIQQMMTEIDNLKKEIDNLKSASSIPYDVERALRTRGFLKSEDFIISGQATLSVGGTAYIPMSVGINAIALATYSDGTGSDIGAVIVNNSVLFPNTMQLSLNGIGTKTVYYIVFKTADKTQ